MLGVNLREAEDARPRLRRRLRHAVTRSLFDRNGEVARTWRIGGPTQGLPSSYFIDRDGVVRKVVFGTADGEARWPKVSSLILRGGALDGRSVARRRRAAALVGIRPAAAALARPHLGALRARRSSASWRWRRCSASSSRSCRSRCVATRRPIAAWLDFQRGRFGFLTDPMDRLGLLRGVPLPLVRLRRWRCWSPASASARPTACRRSGATSSSPRRASRTSTSTRSGAAISSRRRTRSAGRRSCGARRYRVTLPASRATRPTSSPTATPGRSSPPSSATWR